MLILLFKNVLKISNMKNCSPEKEVEGVAPLPGDFRVIVCPTQPQMNDFCDLLGTPDAPVSKIVSVKGLKST